MSAGCVRWMLCRTVRAVCAGSCRGYWTPASAFTVCSERSNIIASSLRWTQFSTVVDSTGQTQATEQKKSKPKGLATLSPVGRTIPQREIQVISKTGENLGIMHRADVIRIMDEQDLKLVLRNGSKDPAVYQLMSSKQISEEQKKRREKQKAAMVQVKELTVSPSIAAHDLSTKLKQVESWLEKKNHVRITLRSRRGGPAVSLDAALEQMVQKLEMVVGFVSAPKIIRDGQAAMCVLRLPSAKELSDKKKNKAEASQSDDTCSKDTESKTPTPPVSNTDTTEESTKQ